MSELVTLANVRKTYQRGSERLVALDVESLLISAGEFVAITGPSGSGKTTLLNLVGCIDIPDAGSVRIDGIEINDAKEQSLTEIRARKIGFVFQQFFLLPTLTVEENVLLPALFLRNGRKAEGRSRQLLEQVGLKDRYSTLAGPTLGRRDAARGHRSRANQQSQHSPGG